MHCWSYGSFPSDLRTVSLHTCRIYPPLCRDLRAVLGRIIWSVPRLGRDCVVPRRPKQRCMLKENGEMVQYEDA